MKNSVDLRDYKLIIEMIGDTYFGELNLDMVTLTNGNVSYPLDIVSVTGFSVVNRTKTSPGEYKIECGFEDDLEEVKSIFSMDDDFDLDQNVASLLKDKSFVGKIDLHDDDDLETSKAVAGRITSMRIINVKDSSFSKLVFEADK